ncbi:hypothetical protein [Xanthomonas phage JGB6]|nr:hypothetical protein [Xanthomonas phage JGB6]
MKPSDTIYEAINALGGARSVTGRVEILKKYDSELFRKILYMTYNPYIRFGIKVTASLKSQAYSVSLSASIGLDIEADAIWDTLTALSRSTASSGHKATVISELAKRTNTQTIGLLMSILEKSLVTGVSASTVNKAFPGLIPEFKVQLAQKYADKKIRSFPQYAEIKYDGLRAIGKLFPTGEVEITTRTGRPIPAAQYFHKELARFGAAYRKIVPTPAHGYTGCVTDGELCGESFNQAVSTFRSNEIADSGTCRIFDVLPMESLSDPDFVSDDFETRKALLADVFAELDTESKATLSPIQTIMRSVAYKMSSKREIWDTYKTARLQGHEGLIIKDPSGLWRPKRSNDWMKIKAEETADLRIIGAFEGEGEKTGTLGGLIVDRDGVQVRVGSGFTAEMSDKLWFMFCRDYDAALAGATDSEDFELIGRLAEVQYQEVTPDGSLRHPVFIRVRNDKDEFLSNEAAYSVGGSDLLRQVYP